MKKKLNSLLAVLMVFMLILGMTPSTTFAAGKKKTPGTVTLTKISAPAYNKINIRWKRTSNATHYKIYYKKTGARKWTGIATVSGKTTSYTHTSSKAKPIVVGQKYTYTVKGYNSKYKTSGRYNRKGLTARTKPSTVKLSRVSLSSNKKSVTVSWKRASGCNYYRVFRKTPSIGWKRLTTLRSPQTSYVDRNPVKGQKNIYTVRGYYSPTRMYGNYNSRGISVNVPRSGSSGSKKLTPGTVSLSKISSPAYNKINIQWKRTSNATHYKIYYKKTGSSRWTGLATVSGRTTSYTHTSSKAKPIVAGQKYTYTVKGYNSKYKTNGRYNSKGLTTRTKLATVKLKRAVLSGDKKSVKVSWNPVSGCNQYFVYRKTPSTGWKRIGTVSSRYTSYTDRNPINGQKNIYTVRAYYSPTKSLGGYNTTGCSVSVPKPTANRPVSDTKPRYTYDIKIINTYNEFYNELVTAPFFYIKTNNPRADSIRLHWSPDAGIIQEESIQNGQYRDVKGTRANNSNMLKVSGGYIIRCFPRKAGTYNVQVRELKPQYLNNPLYADSSLNCCYETNASLRVSIKDYQKSYSSWINGLIKKYTKPGMTPKEEFEAVIYGEFVNDSRYRYPTTIRGESGYAPMLKEEGAIWQNRQLNSFTSPNLMYSIGQTIGYPVEIISYDISNPDHHRVKGPDGELYSICPMVSTGQINKNDIKYIDFSKY